jgi:probable rRNA maturation factor
MPKQEEQTIQFHYLYKPFYFPNRKQLKRFIINLFHKEGFKVSHINYIFCSDSYLLKVNQKYLKHNTYTDIITFPFSYPGSPLVSDVYISVDRIKENARRYERTFIEELHRVIFHGALHLVGYNDKKPAEIRAMRAREGHYLELFFVSRNTVSLRN